MKLSQGFWQTFKETPADAEVISHKLMVRAGLIQKSYAGLYNYLPIGLRAMRKVENIVRDELNKAGCFEVIMSVATPAELWKESGRWDIMGAEMLRMKDRGQRDLCFSPTNEEAIVDIFRKAIKSYKQLPVNLYQINTKFRDETRPRYGVMRAREFTMKDAYSFHDSKESLRETYEKMYVAYSNIFTRMGLKFIAVEADGGNMAAGGAKTHEFQVLAHAGEDKVIRCKKCDYAANIERAHTKRATLSFNLNSSEMALVSTPNKESITDVSALLNIPAHHCLKSVVFSAITGEKEEFILAQLLGDDEINEIKLKGILGCDHLRAATDSDLIKLGLIKGYMGPYQTQTAQNNLKIIYDKNVKLEASYVIGAMKKDYHYTGFVPQKYPHEYSIADLALSKAGDLCASCDGEVEQISGIEVGHIFELGDRYTKAMGVTILDKNGKATTPIMGCYGIGIGRTVASAIEQNNDADGIIWPVQIAPYHVYFLLVSKDDSINQLANEIYDELNTNQVETILDDRNAAIGFKFKDADLLGLPLTVVLGERDYKQDGMLEIIIRKDKTKIKTTRDKLLETVKKILHDLAQ